MSVTVLVGLLPYITCFTVYGHLLMRLRCFDPNLGHLLEFEFDFHTFLLICVTTPGKEQDQPPGKKAHTSSLAETEEALAQAVWCWAGIAP